MEDKRDTTCKKKDKRSSQNDFRSKMFKQQSKMKREFLELNQGPKHCLTLINYIFYITENIIN